MYIKKFNLEKLRQTFPILALDYGRDMSKKAFTRKLISVLFELFKDKDDDLDATMITQEIKLRNPKH